MRRLFLFSVILVFFFGYDVLLSLGYLNSKTFFSKIHPSVYIALTAFLLVSKKWITLKQEFISVVFITALYFFVTFMGGDIDSAFLVNAFVLPVLFSALILSFGHKRYNLTNDLKNLIIYFFIIECLFAVFEQVFKVNVIWIKDDRWLLTSTETSGFRSSALLGAPLENALCVSSIMTFILLSNIKRKYLLWSLGFIAILCFNARSSIVISVFLLLIYTLRLLFARHKANLKEKRMILLYLLVGAIGIGYLMVEYNLGDRLFKMGLYDDSSANVRVEILQIFKYYDWKSFLFGISKMQSERVMSGAGIDNFIIENYWISFILQYGFIGTILIIVIYGAFLNKITKIYSKFAKYFVLGCFFVISSTNNSLATNTLDFTIFVLCCYAFGMEINETDKLKFAAK